MSDIDLEQYAEVQKIMHALADRYGDIQVRVGPFAPRRVEASVEEQRAALATMDRLQRQCAALYTVLEAFPNHRPFQKGDRVRHRKRNEPGFVEVCNHAVGTDTGAVVKRLSGEGVELQDRQGHIYFDRYFLEFVPGA